MSWRSDEPPEPPTLAALVELQRNAGKPWSAAELDDGLRALRERVAVGRSRRSLLARGAVAALAVAVLVAAGSRLLVPMLRGPLAPPASPAVAVDRIEGGVLLDGGYLSESGHVGIRLYFSEGSRFALQPGTRGRLREVTRDGAALSIENGAASFHITPDPTHHWSIVAGPFLVTVKGTVFDVVWEPTAERFDLTLKRGRVVVTGPLAGGSISLRAGQHLAVRLPDAETLLTESAESAESGQSVTNETRSGAADPIAAPSTSPPEPSAAPPGVTSTGRHRMRRAPSDAGATALADRVEPRKEQRGWPALLAAGAWDQILAELERRGLDATLEGAPGEDLLALADAARYRHRLELARSALLAERRRFPTSPRALDALFLLGRVAELREDGGPRAVALYDEYLSDAPDGPYAAEALGRKMVLSNDGKDATKGRVRAIAREYLRRFPAGSYAAAARALTRGP